MSHRRPKRPRQLVTHTDEHGNHYKIPQRMATSRKLTGSSPVKSTTAAGKQRRRRRQQHQEDEQVENGSYIMELGGTTLKIPGPQASQLVIPEPDENANPLEAIPGSLDVITDPSSICDENIFNLAFDLDATDHSQSKKRTRWEMRFKAGPKWRDVIIPAMTERFLTVERYLRQQLPLSDPPQEAMADEQCVGCGALRGSHRVSCVSLSRECCFISVNGCN